MDDAHAEEVGQFERVGNLFPDEYELVSVESGSSVSDALRLMLEGRYSQLPVMGNGEVLGVVTLWAIARHVDTSPKVGVHTLEVDDLLDRIPSITVDSDLHSVLRDLEIHEALLVESPRGAQALATQWDFLKYFYQVARPYVLLREIELSLRALVVKVVGGEALLDAIEAGLGDKYRARGRPLPGSVDEMEFDDYRTIITARANWEEFSRVLGQNKDHVNTNLSVLAKIRNKVFHFRSDTSLRDHQRLVAIRDWLVTKLDSIPREV